MEKVMRMARRLLPVAFLLLYVLSALPAVVAAAESSAAENSVGSTVYVIRAEQSIESGLQEYLKRAYSEAEEASAQHIILVLNTYGGRVDSAEDIGRIIRTSKVPYHGFCSRKSSISRYLYCFECETARHGARQHDWCGSSSRRFGESDYKSQNRVLLDRSNARSSDAEWP